MPVCPADRKMLAEQRILITSDRTPEHNLPSPGKGAVTRRQALAYGRNAAIAAGLAGAFSMESYHGGGSA
ncbi:hypothetical protein [Streptomyces sp. NPDC058092]|uniref:hypothetical protein n=1 Tax=Streptomyces sp. NPDC058092 TaxID=3346336 RepID=UPI0036E4E5D8